MDSEADPAIPEAPLDSGAREVIQRAYGLARDEKAGAVHLLRALLVRGGPFGKILRELRLQADLSGIPAEEEDVPLHVIVRAAAQTAEVMGCLSTGRQHLLVAAVDAARGALRERLAAQGVDAGRVREVLSRASEYPPDEPRPTSVSVIAGLLMLNAIGCGSLCSVMLSGTGFYAGYGGQGDQKAFLAWAAWSVLAQFVLGVGLLERQAWAWSGGVGFLTLQAISMVPVLGTSFAPPVLLGLLVYAGAAAELFMRRAWFGVPARRPSRVLWQSGGWAMVPTLVLQLWLLLAGR